MNPSHPHAKPKWPLYAGLFVWLAIAAAIALAFIESWWG
jgi:hypothetical protein